MVRLLPQYTDKNELYEVLDEAAQELDDEDLRDRLIKAIDEYCAQIIGHKSYRGDGQWLRSRKN